MITSITVSNLQKWVGQNFSSLKKFSGGDVWVEIRERTWKTTYDLAPDGSYNYPLFYKSPVVYRLCAYVIYIGIHGISLSP